MAQTKIEWADAVWNPITGCTPISDGCDHCYAKRMANRLAGRYGYPADEPFRVTYHQKRIDEPARLKKPKRIFVCSMGDIFHDDVPTGVINEIFSEMVLVSSHTFMVLTKRPQRMRDYLATTILFKNIFHPDKRTWPGSTKIWLGVTAENQARADERIPVLLDTPAAVRFVSIEPMLGPVEIGKYLPHKPTCRCPQCYHNAFDHVNRGGLDWVIAGGETGPGARPAQAEWFTGIVNQCKGACVPVFVKKAPAGVDVIREFPTR